MRNEVIEAFIDKDTGKRHPAGSFYETADNKRVAYLQQRGYLGSVSLDSDPLDGNVEQVKDAIQLEFGKAALDSLLASEKKGKNRKGVMEHIEELLSEVDAYGSTDKG